MKAEDLLLTDGEFEAAWWRRFERRSAAGLPHADVREEICRAQAAKVLALVDGRLTDILDTFWARRTTASRASNTCKGLSASVHRAQLAAYDRCLSHIQRLKDQLAETGLTWPPEEHA